jgi:hypothetical protein
VTEEEEALAQWLPDPWQLDWRDLVQAMVLLGSLTLQWMFGSWLVHLLWGLRHVLNFQSVSFVMILITTSIFFHPKTYFSSFMLTSSNLLTHPSIKRHKQNESVLASEPTTTGVLGKQLWTPQDCPHPSLEKENAAGAARPRRGPLPPPTNDQERVPPPGYSPRF